MGQKKSKKLLIVIIILVILLIIVGGFTFAFVATDIFRSDKTLFFKYISQIADEKIVEYYTKIENNAYEDKGNFSVEITKDGEKLDSLQYINNFNISYEGKVKVSENKAEQAISINYSDNVNFPINYRQINNIIGLQTKYVGSKYIAVEEGKEVTSEAISIPAINISKSTSNNENNQEEVLKKYVSILQENLQDSNFSKEVKDNLTGYKLSLNSEQIKNILTQLLNTLKTDETTLKAINENTNSLIETIDNAISSIENYFNENNQENITIIVYEQNKELTQINITISEKLEIDVKKSKNENEIAYETTIKENNNAENPTEFILTIKYSGLQDMNTGEETYELGMNIPMESSQTEQENNDTDITPLSIEQEKDVIELLIADTKSNKLLSNEDTESIAYEDIEQTLSTDTDEAYSKMNLSKETDTTYGITFTDTQDKFILDVSGEIIQEPEENNNDNNTDNNETNENADTQNTEILSYKYKINNTNTFVDNVEIEELKDENAIILTTQEQSYVEDLLGKISERLVLVNERLMQELELTANQNPILLLNPATLVLANSSSGTLSSSLSEMEIASFNEKFTLYENTNQKGATVKGLLTVIENNNSSQDNETKKIKEINFDGQEYEVTEQNITLIKSNINVDDSYKVEFEIDENTGLIYRAVINKK